MTNDREVMLKRIQVCDFALNDAALYLDTHPEDAMALAYYKKYLELRAETVAAYVKKYGPISHSDYDGGPRWKWVDEPWPWQKEEA